MSPPPQLLTEIAEAITDGREPDWDSLDLSHIDHQQRTEIAQLRVVLDIARRLGTVSLSSGLFSTSMSGTRSASEAARIDDAPASWGSLQIRERVGRGRFGDVYRAWDPALDRDVALKILRPDRRGRDTADAGVVREAQLMARVRHPNVVAIYGASRLDGRTGLSMEFIEGGTLEAELVNRRRFEPDEIAQIGVELCAALTAVHEAGLVHRDVKAPNVMRDRAGRVVLGDFGTGLELDDDLIGVSLAGTPLYFAPELFAGVAATPQSDLYSLGVLLCHLATGEYPVTGRSISELRRNHRAGTRRRLRVMRPELPAALTDAVDRVLHPDPAQRFTTARDLMIALTAVLHPPVSASPAPAPRRWRMMAAWLAAGSVTIAAGVMTMTPSGIDLLSAGGPFGPRQTSGAAADTVRLSRVPAPMDITFWGQPSHDGKSHTFIDFDLNVALFDTTSGERRRLTDTVATGGEAYMTAAFSADDRRIAYSWETPDGVQELRAIDVAGGTPRVIARHARDIMHALAWSHDDRHLLTRIEPPFGTTRLAWVSADSGATRTIAALDAGYELATLSPDSRYVIFDKMPHPGTMARDIYIADLEAATDPVALVAQPADDFAPMWTPDGNAVVFISNRTREPSVWSVTVRNGATEGDAVMRHRNIGRAWPAGMTHDGTIYYQLHVGLVDVSIAAVDFASGQLLEPPRPALADGVGSNMNSSWSPDGRALAFVRIPFDRGDGGERRLAVLDLQSGATNFLSPVLSYLGMAHWSPDGTQMLAKGVDVESRRGLFLVDAAGDRRVTLAAVIDARTPAEIGAFAWGRERKLLFTREGIGLIEKDLDTGVERIELSFAAEGISRMGANPGFRLSPDGRSLVYVGFRPAGNGRQERVLRLKEGSAPTRDLARAASLGGWTPDGRHVLITLPTPKADTQTLWVVPIDGGEPRPTALQARQLRDISVHPDGKRVTFTSGLPGREVWRLEGFLPRQ